MPVEQVAATFATFGVFADALGGDAVGNAARGANQIDGVSHNYFLKDNDFNTANIGLLLLI
jgi:hypothetical protein